MIVALTRPDERLLLVDHDDRHDEQTDDVESVQHEQETLSDESLGDHLFEGECRADGEVTI